MSHFGSKYMKPGAKSPGRGPGARRRPDEAWAAVLRVTREARARRKSPGARSPEKMPRECQGPGAKAKARCFAGFRFSGGGGGGWGWGYGIGGFF
jgi:hypothetical protein